MLRDLIRLFVESLGLVKDASEAAIRSYLGLLKRMAVPTLFALGISTLFAVVAVVSDVKLLNVAAVTVGGAVAILWVVLTAPFIAAGTKIAEFEFLKPTLGFLQFVAGSAFFLSLLAGVVPADSEGISKLTVAAVSLASALFVFGLARSLLWLRIKVGVIVGLMILASILPRTSGAIPGVLEMIDHFLSGCAGPTELVLTEEVLQSKLLFDSEGPRYWCRPALDRDSGYRCYNRKGRDPHTNDELIPINPTIVTDAARRLEEIKRRRQEAARASSSEGAAPSPQADSSMPLSSSSVPQAADTGTVSDTLPVREPAPSLLQPYIASGAATARVAIAIAEDSLFDDELMHRVRVTAQIGLAGTVSDDVFSESLVADGVLDRLMAGDRALLESLPRPAADYLALGRARVGEQTSGLTRSTVADISIEMRIIDGRTGQILAERQFKHRAIGYSSDEALETARTEAGDEIAKWVRAEVARR